MFVVIFLNAVWFTQSTLDLVALVVLFLFLLLEMTADAFSNLLM